MPLKTTVEEQHLGRGILSMGEVVVRLLSLCVNGAVGAILEEAFLAA